MGSIQEIHDSVKACRKHDNNQIVLLIEDFALMVNDIKTAKRISQGPTYDLSKNEAKSKVFRRSIFAVSDIEERETFSKDNIRIIRPSDGLPPIHWKLR